VSRSSLAAIVRALGGDLYDGGYRAVVPGVGHSPADRSVSLLLANGRVVAHSFAGDDWRDVLDDLRARGLIDAENRLVGGQGGLAPGRPSERERRAVAARLWAEARELPGTLGERHVRSRSVARGLSPALRFHADVPSAVYLDRGVRRPALLAAIQDPAGALTGVEVTYLAPTGDAARLAVPRKTVGVRPSGAAVRLDAPGPRLLVGEGVFTCLSASEALGLPAWALLAVGNLRAWTPPPEVERVLIAADRGAPGEMGAAALARRLRFLGVQAEVRPPPQGFADWNDAARAGGGGEAGKAGPVWGMGPRPVQEPEP
jgi:hypothetical protein